MLPRTSGIKKNVACDQETIRRLNEIKGLLSGQNTINNIVDILVFYFYCLPLEEKYRIISHFYDPNWPSQPEVKQ